MVVAATAAVGNVVDSVGDAGGAVRRRRVVSTTALPGRRRDSNRFLLLRQALRLVLHGSGDRRHRRQ